MRVKVVKYICKDEEGRRWEEELHGYCKSLDSALAYIRIEGHTDLTVMGFEINQPHDSRHFTYRLYVEDFDEVKWLD